MRLRVKEQSQLRRLPIWVEIHAALPIWVGLHAARLLESEGSMIKLEPDKSQLWLEYGETERNWEKIQKKIQDHPFNHAVRSLSQPTYVTNKLALEFYTYIRCMHNILRLYVLRDSGTKVAVYYNVSLYMCT